MPRVKTEFLTLGHAEVSHHAHVLVFEDMSVEVDVAVAGRTEGGGVSVASQRFGRV